MRECKRREGKIIEEKGIEDMRRCRYKNRREERERKGKEGTGGERQGTCCVRAVSVTSVCEKNGGKQPDDQQSQVCPRTSWNILDTLFLYSQNAATGLNTSRCTEHRSHQKRLSPFADRQGLPITPPREASSAQGVIRARLR